MAVNLTHVQLAVGGYAECFRFYRDALGLTPTLGHERSSYGEFRNKDGATLALADVASNRDGNARHDPRALLIFTVEDVEAAALAVADHLIADPQQAGGGRGKVARAGDPAGNVVELHEPASGSGALAAHVDQEAETTAAPSLMWARLVVDDFPATLAFYRRLMSLATLPAPGHRLEDHGYARLWNCSTPNYVELELVARDHFRDVLGESRVAEPLTLVFHSDDVARTVDMVRDAGGQVIAEPQEIPGQNVRFGQVQDAAGTAIELAFAWIESFGVTTSLSDVAE